MDCHRYGLPVCIQVVYNGLGVPYPQLVFGALRAEWRCSRARALPHYKWQADTFKRAAETGPRLANFVGKGRLGLTDFLPKALK